MNRPLKWACVLACCQVLLIAPVSARGLLHAQGHTFRWGDGHERKTQTITYTILQARYSVPGSKSIVSPDNCGSMHPFSNITSNSPSLSPAIAEQQLHQALAAWAEVADIEFVEVANVPEANIVFGAADQTAGRAFTNLSYVAGHASQPISKALGKSDEPTTPDQAEHQDTIAEIEQAYVCLSPARTWKVGFDGDLKIYDLKYTFTHEIGHAIGLDHPGKTGTVMAYRYDETISKLAPTDIAAVQSIYGPSRKHSVTSTNRE